MTKTLVSLALGLAALTASPLTLAANYLPLQAGDKALFINDGTALDRQQTPVSITAVSGSWRQYRDFLGYAEQWISTSPNNEAVYVKNSQGTSSLLVNFNHPVGSQYSPGLLCMKSAKLAQKGLQLKTEAGTFTQVIRVDFTPGCKDSSAPLRAWFAPGVGLVRYETNYRFGPINHELAGGYINGQSLPQGHRLTFSIEAPSEIVIAQDPAKTPYITALFSVKNSATEPGVRQYVETFTLDVVLLEAHSGVEVKRWSAESQGGAEPYSVSLAAGQTERFVSRLPLTDRQGLRLLGDYVLRLEYQSAAASSGRPLAATETRLTLLPELLEAPQP